MNDPRVQAFRKELNKWKKDTFFPRLVEENDSESIDRRIKEAHSMYETLMNRLHDMEQQIQQKKNQQGGDIQAQKILDTLGPENTWSEALLDNARSILITDLFEYPLTFNSTLIDQFKQESDFPKY
jgi:hypothetical protein